MARKAMKQHEMVLVHLLKGETVDVSTLKGILPSGFNWKELYKYVARIKLRCGGIVSTVKQGKEIMSLTLTNPEKFQVGQIGPRWSDAFRAHIYGDTPSPIVAKPVVKAVKAVKVVKEKPIKADKAVKVVKEKPVKAVKVKAKGKVNALVPEVTTLAEAEGSKIVELIRAELEATKDTLVVKAANRKTRKSKDPESIRNAEPMQVDWTQPVTSLAVDKEFDGDPLAIPAWLDRRNKTGIADEE